MGAFRSTPDTVKHKSTKTYNGLNYTVAHMCGN